jgi:hypothetical protein
MRVLAALRLTARRHPARAWTAAVCLALDVAFAVITGDFVVLVPPAILIVLIAVLGSVALRRR